MIRRYLDTLDSNRCVTAIVCDARGCECHLSVLHIGGSADAEVLEMARVAGWSAVSNGSRVKDYCPEHGKGKGKMKQRRGIMAKEQEEVVCDYARECKYLPCRHKEPHRIIETCEGIVVRCVPVKRREP